MAAQIQPAHEPEPLPADLFARLEARIFARFEVLEERLAAVVPPDAHMIEQIFTHLELLLAKIELIEERLKVLRGELVAHERIPRVDRRCGTEPAHKIKRKRGGRAGGRETRKKRCEKKINIDHRARHDN